MKEFDLEAAKRGEPIQTRNGRPAKFIAHVPKVMESHRVVIQYEDLVSVRFEDGRSFSDRQSDLDLLMAPRKRTVWVNLHPYAGISTSYGYPATVYATKEMADAVSNQDRQGNRAWPLEIEE